MKESDPDDIVYGWQIWLKTKPISVQETANKYPPMTRVSINFPGKVVTHFVIGYREEDHGSVGLLVSDIDPILDYDRALESAITICAAHLA